MRAAATCIMVNVHLDSSVLSSIASCMNHIIFRSVLFNLLVIADIAGPRP